MNPVWYIHGANSTPRSFNYIRSKMPEHRGIEVVYTHSSPAHKVLDTLVENLDRSREPVTLVGHSLGGVLAVAAAMRSPKVAKVATLAAPLGGSQVASLMRWITPCQLLDDIHPYAPLITAVKNGRLTVPTLSIVTTAGGTAMLSGENDGVVTVASQTSIRGPVYMRFKVNHSEVLMCDDVIDLLTPYLLD